MYTLSQSALDVIQDMDVVLTRSQMMSKARQYLVKTGTKRPSERMVLQLSETAQLLIDEKGWCRHCGRIGEMTGHMTCQFPGGF